MLYTADNKHAKFRGSIFFSYIMIGKLGNIDNAIYKAFWAFVHVITKENKTNDIP